MNHDVFISYSSKKKSIADGVCHYLEENGIKCWMAPRDIPPGTDYGDLIDDAIIDCKVVVLVYSQPASLSKWVKGEISVAFDEGKTIIPFRIDDTAIKGTFRVMLNQVHWIEAYPEYADLLPDLLHSVTSNIGLNPQPIPKPQPQPVPQPQPEPQKEKIPFTVGGIEFKMVFVEGGTYTMGATPEQGSDAYDWEKPTHSVTLSDYYIGETEVTQELWKAVMGNNPSYFEGDNLPVEQVSYEDVKTFITKLNQKTGKTFRLPTEAEWEYAARGGKKSRGYKYSGSNNIDDVAWYYENSGDKRLNDDTWDVDELDRNNCRTHPVKTKQPNELGIYDMSGNVYEWCSDWYGDYSRNAQTNPQGPSFGSNRVFRGGSWDDDAERCRVAFRDGSLPSGRYDILGFRLALSR